jgi:RNA polymerase sigma-70 factor (ECF subfamily)
VKQIEAEHVRRLFDAHGPALMLFARQWCHAPDDALQEALLELLNTNRNPLL